jgi:ferrous iron transport protein B
LSSFPGAPAGATQPAIDYSLAGMIGHLIHPLLAPIGFTWQMAIALIPGMAAREVAVAALGTVYAVSGESGSSLAMTLSQQWSLATALSFLVWYVFAPQCMSTLAVVRRETGGWLWPTVMFSYMLTLAYASSFIVYHVTVLLAH